MKNPSDAIQRSRWNKMGSRCSPTNVRRINRSDAGTIRQALDQLAAKGSVRKMGDEFVVEAQMEAASARDLNRTLLSALRREKNNAPCGMDF
jgi:hypothetical protein